MSKMLAAILAGGRGEGLSVLTEKRAEAAVPFAGKYRIIDFVLSNCVNSGIYDVAVLTQYRRSSLARPHRHRQALGPRPAAGRRAPAPALYGPRGVGLAAQAPPTPSIRTWNSSWRASADYVLVLAGDHIYRMDYRPMIAFHQQHSADVTLGGVVVPLEEATRFGILETDASGRVVSFEEKPPSRAARWAQWASISSTARPWPACLLRDEHARRPAAAAPSQHDFGRNIIPGMVARGERVYAYPFGGYWQDVGTVQSYWEAHMDLLDDQPAFDLYDPAWVIHTRSEERPPAHVQSTAQVHRSLIAHGCIIKGQVEHSVLSPGVVVEAGAVVRDSIVLFDVVIGAGSVVDRAILDKEVVVGQNCRIGGGRRGDPEPAGAGPAEHRHHPRRQTRPGCPII